MLLVEIPWTSRVWPWPLLSVMPLREAENPQEDDPMALATAFVGEALLPIAEDRGCSRPCLRLSDAAFSLPIALSKPLTRSSAACAWMAPSRRPLLCALLWPEGERARLKGEPLLDLSVVAQEPKTVWKMSRSPTATGAHSARSSRFRDGRVVLHGLVRRSLALGVGA
jgi:hypothetical protein